MKAYKTGKQHLALTAILITLLLAGACLLFTACNRNDVTSVYAETCYDMSITVEGNEVFLKETVLYTNSTENTLSELKFHLYPNAFNENSNAPFLPAELKDVYYEGESFGGIEVLSVSIDRINCDFEICGVDNTILSLPCNLEPGATVGVTLDAKVTLPKCISRFGVTEQTVNLTGFYPLLCRYENGWRDDGYSAIGDPFFADMASYYASVSYPQNYTLAAHGITEQNTLDGITTAEITAEHIRDFALVLSEDFTAYNAVARLEDKEIDVLYYSLSDKDAQSSVDLAADVIEKFSSAFGAYPYDDYTLVQAPVNSGGMEYGGLAILSPSLDKENYRATIIHETAHQWWYNTVGNDQLNTAWLDEGLAEFCTYYYHSLLGDEAVFRKHISSIDDSYSVWRELPPSVGFNSNMERHLDSFLTQGEYVAVVYDKGALLFAALLDLVGKDSFNASLKTYYDTNKFGIADKTSLISAFEKNGCLVGGIIESWVNGKAKV